MMCRSTHRAPTLSRDNTSPPPVTASNMCRTPPQYLLQYPSCYSPSSDDDEDGGPRDGRPDCPHRYGSILSSSYFTLLNLFGEFPLMDNHSTAGRFIGVFTAVVRKTWLV